MTIKVNDFVLSDKNWIKRTPKAAVIPMLMISPVPFSIIAPLRKVAAPPANITANPSDAD